MSPPGRQERISRRTGKALARWARAEEESKQRGDEPPRPGDIFVFAETAEYPVQWAVIERSPEPPNRLQVVAADLDPVLGSADVAVEAGARCGALTLRCRFAAWLDAAAFDPELRAGFLESEVLDRVRRKRAAIVAGDPMGSSMEQETDRESEYRDLEEELEQARAVLLETRHQRG